MDDYLINNKYDAFDKFQKPLLFLANNNLGRKYLGIDKEVKRSEKIVALYPNSYKIQTSKKGFKQRFRCYDLFGKKLNHLLNAGLGIGSLLASQVSQPVALAFGLTTLSWYSGAGDGHVGTNEHGNNWAAAVSDTVGNLLDYTSSVPGEIGGVHTDKFWLYRWFYPIDTTLIPREATITSATFNLRSQARTLDYTNDSQGYSVVVSANQASTSVLATTDLPNVGATEVSDKKVFRTDWSPGTYVTHTLTSTGIDLINKGSYTKLAIRSGFDVNGVTPNTGQDTNLRVHAYMSERTGTSDDPYLEVNYFQSITHGVL